MLLSFVVPSYCEEGNVEKLYNEIERVYSVRDEEFEVVFVDDGSTDGTLERLRVLNREHANVRVISFSRNFGKDAAIYAGLEAAEGGLVCIIDADLQQRPEVTVSMLEEFYRDPSLDCVAAYQEKRKEGRFISSVKSFFYKLICKMSDVEFKNGASDFRMMRRNMVNAVLSMPERVRFSKGIFSYVGFNTKYIPYTVMDRESGSTKWNFRKLLRYGTDGIISFSSSPLKIPSLLGTLSVAGSLIYLLVLTVLRISVGYLFPSYALPVILILFIGGVQLLCIGLIGKYLASVHTEIKGRPLYIIKHDLRTRLSLKESEKEVEYEHI